MFTVTFYSYKGGVGRTLALANVAYVLATEGGKQRVVVVDFDLEAPGIDTIAPFDSGKATEKGGVVEYIAGYWKSREPNPAKLPSLLPYACEVDSIPNLVVVPAGLKDGQYQETLTCLNWERFYKVKQGYRFFEQFKRKIEEEFDPDYLLIDSRTGLADVSGITTHQLADLVVLVFNLNRQNLDGITRCYQSIVSTLRPRPVKTMLVASPIPQGHLLDSNLLDSRLKEAADAMPDVVSCSLTGVDRIVQIPYHPALSLMDVVFVQAYPADQISGIYRRIAETVQKCNPAEMKFLLERAFRYRNENRFEEAEEEFRAVVEQHPSSAEGRYLYGDFLIKQKEFAKAIVQLDEACRLTTNVNSRYLYALGTALTRVNRNEAALEKLKLAERVEPANEAVLLGISSLLSKMGDTTKALEYWRKIKPVKAPATKFERLQHFQRFTAMSPGFLSSSLGLPADFDRQGFLERLEKTLIFDYATKSSILESILDQSSSAQQIQELDDLLMRQQSHLSEILEDYFHLVQSKVRQGDLDGVDNEEDLKRLIKSEKTGAHAFRLCLAMAKMGKERYREAVDIIAKAFESPIHESGQAPFYWIWGDAIAELAEQADSRARKVELLHEATQKYAAAVRIKPNKHKVLNNWGNGLVELAALCQGPDREALLREAVEKYAEAVEIKPDLHEVLNNWGNALVELGGLREGLDREALLREAVEKYAKAVEIKPDLHEALNNWGNALGELAVLRQGPDREALLREAIEKYARALDIKPGDHEALNNWGGVLGKLAALHEGPDREVLLKEAVEKFAKAVEIKPDNQAALNNWGNALGKLADMHEGHEREALLKEAIEKYTRAVGIKPDYHEALNNWGNALVELAALHEGPDREALLGEAIEKYGKALEIKSDKREALTNWGIALGKLADMHEGQNREALLKEAIEKYTRALEIMPDSHEALGNWSTALIHLSYRYTGRQRIKTLKAALDKAKRAEDLKPGAGIYNMACSYALLGRKKDALTALKKAGESDLKFRKMAASDEDFRSLREDEEFKSIVGT